MYCPIYSLKWVGPIYQSIMSKYGQVFVETGPSSINITCPSLKKRQICWPPMSDSTSASSIQPLLFIKVGLTLLLLFFFGDIRSVKPKVSKKKVAAPNTYPAPRVMSCWHGYCAENRGSYIIGQHKNASFTPGRHPSEQASGWDGPPGLCHLDVNAGGHRSTRMFRVRRTSYPCDSVA